MSAFWQDNGKAAADAANKAAFEKWWDSLTTKAKKAWKRYWQRKAEKKAAWAYYRLCFGGGGYCCPKCHSWYPTAQERNACKQKHREVKA